MSKLLEDLITQSRADAEAYELFLKNAEALVQRMARKDAAISVPAELLGKREAITIYHNLPQILAAAAADTGIAEPKAHFEADLAALALKIDRVMREQAPAGWRGDQARETQVQNALFPLLLRDRNATMALFELVKNQAGY